jgi:kanamycin kinase
MPDPTANSCRRAGADRGAFVVSMPRSGRLAAARLSSGVVLHVPPGVLGLTALEPGTASARCERHYDNEVGVVTHRLTGADGRVWFLKVAPPGVEPPLQQEAERMRWAHGHLLVPKVRGLGSTEAGGTWMLTDALPGEDATRSPLVTRPERLVAALARGLRRFHAAPVQACPFSFRLHDSLALAEDRVRRGAVIPARHFHPEHAHLSSARALDLLVRTRPSAEDLVVCHGDYCLPNALLEADEVTGFVDLGELGVADRFRDLAVATWSVTWNLGPGLEPLFLAAYGAPNDLERIRFYRLLYDLVS